MIKRRRAPNQTERTAACLLMLKRGDDWLIPEPLRSSGTAAEICRAVQWDHAHHHALGGDTRPQNITPMLVGDHKAKSNKDNGIIAKAKRLTKKEEEFRARLLSKAEGEPEPKRRPKAKIPSRGFPSKEERRAAKEWKEKHNGR